MKFDVMKLFKKTSNCDALSCIYYRHTPEYTRYMAKAVSVEKKILTARGLDEFNVGHTTRSFEIEQFIDRELRDAKKQLDEHLQAYKNVLTKRLSEAAEKESEAEQLVNDLVALQRVISNLETILAKEDPKA